jgi:hypothetical protein
MSFQDTNSALTKAYNDIALPVTTFYEGMPGDPPKTGDWAVLSIVPATNQEWTLGVGGQDQESGFMQIDLYTEQGHSTDKLLTWANTVQTALVAGMSFQYGTTTVWIGSLGGGSSTVERTPIRPEGGWMRLTMTVYYYTRFTRPKL